MQVGGPLRIRCRAADAEHAAETSANVEAHDQQRPDVQAREALSVTASAPSGGFDVSRISRRRRCSSLLLIHGNSPSGMPVRTSGLQAENVERPAYTLPIMPRRDRASQRTPSRRRRRRSRTAGPRQCAHRRCSGRHFGNRRRLWCRSRSSPGSRQTPNDAPRRGSFGFRFGDFQTSVAPPCESIVGARLLVQHLDRFTYPCLRP